MKNFAFLCIVSLAILLFNSCNKCNPREKITAKYGISILGKGGAVDFKNVVYFEIGDDFLYFYSNDSGVPFQILKMENVNGITILDKPNQ